MTLNSQSTTQLSMRRTGHPPAWKQQWIGQFPRLQHSLDTASPEIQEGLKTAAHNLADGVATVTPRIQDGLAHLAPKIHDAVEGTTPRLHEAVDRATPVILNARDRVVVEYLPRLSDQIGHASEAVHRTLENAPTHVDAVAKRLDRLRCGAFPPGAGTDGRHPVPGRRT